ncbi:MAG: hypothetical protein FJZ01_05610 [Candidatus Sericytochromatia bacterium]|nr:hypothetical protein [Candidatus Tanganyikabacteria bacterium]
MAVGAIGAPKVSAPGGYQKPPAVYDQVKSVVVPAGAWLYQNVWKPSQGIVKPAGNFWKELGQSTLKNNVMSALWYDGVGSVVRNGLALIQGKENVQRAAGNIVADVGIGAGKGIVSGLAVTGATMGLTAIGLTAAPFLLGWPIMLGTIGVSMLAYKFLNKADQKYGWHQKVSDFVTSKLGGDK